MNSSSANNFINYVLKHRYFNGGDISLFYSHEYREMFGLSPALKNALPNVKIHTCSIEETPIEERSLIANKSDICIVIFNKLTSIKKYEYFNKKVKSFMQQPIDDIFKYIFLVDINNYFDEIYSIPYSRVSALNQGIIDLANLSKNMTITSELGTDLHINLQSCEPWTNLDGINHCDILPSEVATFTHDINGKFVFCGLLLSALPFGLKYGLIGPVFISIEQGIIKSLTTKNKELERDFLTYLDKAPSHRNIEEIGIGTNEGLKRLYPVNAAFAERHPGLHLGLGGKEKGSIHLDLVSNDSQIYFDNQVVFNNRFFI